MKPNKIIKIVDSLFPLSDGLVGDKIGKNFFFQNEKIKKIGIALDLTIDTLKKGIDIGVNFFIVHHAILYDDYKKEIKNPIKKEIFELIEKHKITCYVIHTNYNKSILGDNKNILEKLNFNKIILINENDVLYYGEIFPKTSLIDIIKKLKKYLNLEYIQYIGNINNKISNSIICSGSGNVSIDFFLKNKIDLYITGELKWSNCLFFEQYGINVILLGHYMENIFVKNIYDILIKKITSIEIIKFSKKNILNFIK